LLIRAIICMFCIRVNISSLYCCTILLLCGIHFRATLKQKLHVFSIVTGFMCITTCLALSLIKGNH